MPVSSIGTDEGDAAANAGSTPYARPPRRTGTGMLTLGWAVDQSRRAFRSRTRGSKVHPDGRRSASSRGSEGTPATPTRRTRLATTTTARGVPGPGSRVPPGAGQGTCLGAVMALWASGGVGPRLSPRRSALGGAETEPMETTSASRPSYAARRRRRARPPRVGVQAAPHRDGRPGRTAETVTAREVLRLRALGVDAVHAGAWLGGGAAQSVERSEPGFARHGGAERGDGRGTLRRGSVR